MATVYLRCHSQRVLIKDHNGQFSSLLSSVEPVLGFRPTQLQYPDEEGDLVTVESQFDFEEALKFAQDYGEITFQPLASMEQLPLVQSQIIDPPQSVEPIKPVLLPVEPVDVGKTEKKIDPVTQGEADMQKLPSLESPFLPVPIVPNTPKEEEQGKADIPKLPNLALPVPIPPTASKEEEIVEEKVSPQLRLPTNTQLPPSIVRRPQGYDPLLIQSIIDEELQSLMPARQSLLRSQLAAKSVHVGVKCRLCGVTPIKGARFKCEKCEMDLCEDCEEKQEHEHVLVKYRLPVKQLASAKPQPHLVPAKPIPQLVPAIPLPQPAPVKPNIIPPSVPIKPPPQSQPAALKPSPHKIAQIMELGFTYEQAFTALEVCQDDTNEAVNQLYG